MPLIWTTHRLVDGWVLLCVDVTISLPGEPEALLGYRRAVHFFQFDESDDPVMDFGFVIAEMTYRITRGLEGVGGAPDNCASRVRTFEPPTSDVEDAYRAGRNSVRPQAISVRDMRDLADTSRRLHKHGG